MTNNPRRLPTWEGKKWLVTGAVSSQGLIATLEPSEAIEKMKLHLSNMKLKNWLVGHEWYKEGEHAGEGHFHIVIETYKPVLGGTVRKWFPRMDVEGCHPQGGYETAWNYAMKDNNFATKEKKQGHRSDLDEMMDLIKEGTTAEELWFTHGAKMAQYHRSMEQFEKIVAKRKIDWDEKVDPEKFIVPPYDGWPKPLIVIGKARIGKTAWAMNQFERPCKIELIEDLRDKFDPKWHDGLVFDDVDFLHLPRTSQIHMVDTDYSRSIWMRYFNWNKPKKLKMIFCVNEPCFMDDEAINERVTIWYHKYPMFYKKD